MSAHGTLWPLLLLAVPATAATPHRDATALCEFVAAEYAYLDRVHVDWPATCDALRAELQRAPRKPVPSLEHALAELHDTHAHLNTNTAESPRLVPTDTDLRATWQGGRALITDVRADSGAARAGVRVGDEVRAIDGVPVAAATAVWAPRHATQPDAAAQVYALQIAIAGRHREATRRLQLQRGDQRLELSFTPGVERPAGLLGVQKLGEVGVIRLHNSLGDDALVPAFDAALQQLDDVRALVLDLRDTPSGGNTQVARGIMSRFVAAPRPYQQHEYVAEFRRTGVRRLWVEYVAPRGSAVRKPVVVLVGAWTGSMGEGLAIGLNAAIDAPVMGRPMAGLLGALGELTLPDSGITVRIPVEQLFHVNGTPREQFLPQALGSSDPADELAEAVRRAGA